MVSKELLKKINNTRKNMIISKDDYYPFFDKKSVDSLNKKIILVDGGENYNSNKLGSRCLVVQLRKIDNFGAIPTLSQISMEINKKYSNEKCDLLILESFEYLLTFYSIWILEKFIYYITKRFEKMGTPILFIYNKSNDQSSIVVPKVEKIFSEKTI
jgi:hypothetical protein